jgi:hypothetical protein
MIIRHLAFWLDVLNTMLPRRQPRIELSVFSGPVLAERVADTVRPALGDWAEFLVHWPDRSHGHGYYSAFALRVTADQGEAELGDGGLTTWTAQLMLDAKERCLVSCIATERLSALAQ